MAFSPLCGRNNNSFYADLFSLVIHDMKEAATCNVLAFVSERKGIERVDVIERSLDQLNGEMAAMLLFNACSSC